MQTLKNFILLGLFCLNSLNLSSQVLKDTIAGEESINSRESPKASDLLVDTISPNSVKVYNKKYYADEDKIIITTENLDTLVYNKQEFYNIVDNLQVLHFNIAQDPETSYHIQIYKDINESNAKHKHIFRDEQGQDEYYILYAYFLKKQNGEKKFEERRIHLLKIFNDINSLFGQLSYGGTYFGHQHARIVGNVEYSISCFAENPEYFTKKYDLTKQKEFYLNSLYQLINDEISVDYEIIDNKAKKKEREFKLYQIVYDLDKLITDNFYLKSAQNFQYSSY